MKSLQGKNIYVVITGSKKAMIMPDVVKEFTAEGANVFVIPTLMARDIMKNNLESFERPRVLRGLSAR